MASRLYLNPVEGLIARMKATAAPLALPSNTQEWRYWRVRLRERLLTAIGPFPEHVPLNAEIVEEHDEGDYLRQKVLYDSEAFASVAAWLLVPKGMRPGERRPAVLCAHGHGRGKDDVAGVLPPPSSEQFAKARSRLEQGNYDYARQLVRRGYVCLAPDWRTFGERAAPTEWIRSYNDACDMVYFGYAYLGFTLLGLDLWDAMRSLDYLETLPFVDAQRIGMVGLSFGGTMTTFLSALEERIKCAVISCYFCTIQDAMGHRGKANTCGSQFVPGLLTFGEISTVAGLIAPRPCLVEIGEKDQGFFKDDALICYENVARIYAAAGAADRLDVDVHPGGHAFSGAKAFAWFAKWL